LIELKIKYCLNLEEVINLFFDQTKHNDYFIKPIIEEINLIYVAITRSIKDKNIRSESVLELLNNNKKSFLEKLYNMAEILDK
jgi:superfamily I DNA/RNA helicase